jgi:excisionase family DNA binding protein
MRDSVPGATALERLPLDSAQNPLRVQRGDPEMAQSLPELPFVLTVQQVQKILRVSKTTAYELVNSGTLESVKIGRTFRVTRSAFAKFLGLPDEPAATLTA